MKTLILKTQKKTLTMLSKKIKELFVFALILTFCCCSNDGPAGAAGKAGLNGTAGANGSNGNANVKQFTFGPRTFTTNIIYTVPNITQSALDNSVILCYARNGIGTWYSIPGTSQLASFTARNFYYINSSNLLIDVRLLNANGTNYTSTVIFENFRVIIIPGSTNVTLARSASKPDFTKMSYSKVCKYLKIAE